METSVRTVRDESGRIREMHTDSRDVTERVRAEADRASLARITAAVAGGADLGEVAAQVARQAAIVAGAEGAAVVRRHGDEGVVVGASGPSLRLGDVVSLPGVAPGAARVAVAVADEPWGVVMARGGLDAAPDPDVLERLRPLADLVSLSVANHRAHERLVAMATTDPLTALANRRAFRDRLEAECSRASRAGIPLGLVLIDLDHFKRVNDTYGHQVGDAVLRDAAEPPDRAAPGARTSTARIGGEEFAWLMPEADLASAMDGAERLRRRIGDTDFPVAGRVTASLGVAALEPATGPDELVRSADRALYRAKESGRDRCVAWTAESRITEARFG